MQNCKIQYSIEQYQIIIFVDRNVNDVHTRMIVLILSIR